jgi:Arc/MetJ family transcription regulator
MRMNIDIDEHLLREAQTLTGILTTRDTVDLALRELVARHQRIGLLDRAGAPIGTASWTRAAAAGRDGHMHAGADLGARATAETTKPPLMRGFQGGRYWARTSDLRLVEAALSQLS